MFSYFCCLSNIENSIIEHNDIVLDNVPGLEPSVYRPRSSTMILGEDLDEVETIGDSKEEISVVETMIDSMIESMIENVVESYEESISNIDKVSINEKYLFDNTFTYFTTVDISNSNIDISINDIDISINDIDISNSNIDISNNDIFE
jgi:hypothetical protein